MEASLISVSHRKRCTATMLKNTNMRCRFRTGWRACRRAASILGLFAFAVVLSGQSGPQRVLIAINDASSASQEIGSYYLARRAIPVKNVCHLRTTTNEEIARPAFKREIADPIAECLQKQGLTETVFYIVLTTGFPLGIYGSGGTIGDQASVDSELTLLYSDLKSGQPHATAGMLRNPFFGKSGQPFAHPDFPIYLVTRLTAFDVAGAKALVDRSLKATNRGKFVIDMDNPNDHQGNDWLRDAAIRLPASRVVFDQTINVLYGETDVIGYASWGSNDASRHRRMLGYQWLPGAIVTEYVSTDGRTFQRPPDSWTPSGDWKTPQAQFLGSPQGLTADYLQEGATGASGHVYEPYLIFTPRPDLLLPAYYQGRNLAESYYLSLPALSWQNIVVGDPLCVRWALRLPRRAAEFPKNAGDNRICVPSSRCSEIAISPPSRETFGRALKASSAGRWKRFATNPSRAYSSSCIARNRKVYRPVN